MAMAKPTAQTQKGKHFVAYGRFCTTFISIPLELNKLEIKFAL
jgi:hypothetical protein